MIVSLMPGGTEALAALAERKATTAMAKGSLRDAQDNYYQVLVHDPYNQGAREQLAGLLYGEGRLSEAGQLLEEGIRLDPAQADFRLLLARLAISGGDQRGQALPGAGAGNRNRTRHRRQQADVREIAQHVIGH